MHAPIRLGHKPHSYRLLEHSYMLLLIFSLQLVNMIQVVLKHGLASNLLVGKKLILSNQRLCSGIIH